jgi:hypothetical protein
MTSKSLSNTGLKKTPVLVMVAVFVITAGFYYPIWFLRRRNALNEMESSRRLPRWPFVLMLIQLAAEFILGALIGARRPAGPMPWQLDATAVLNIIRLPIGVVMVVESLIAKDILEDHLLGASGNAEMDRFDRDALKLSAMATFFFQLFYLQHVINRIVTYGDGGSRVSDATT